MMLSFSTIFSQVSITSNLPTEISANAGFEAEVKINKGAVSNFAKYQIDVPKGYNVSSIDVKGGNFTFENQRAKIVWVSLPSDAEFAVKFKIQASENALSPGTFLQKFFYLENNEKKEAEAAPATIIIGTGAITTTNPPTTETTETAPKTAEPVTPTPVEPVTPAQKDPATPAPAEPVTPAPVEPVTPAPVEPVASTPVEPAPKPEVPKNNSVSENGATFKVQLGSFSVEPNKNKFSKAGKVSIEFVKGSYKVTVGNFSTKEEAINHLNELKGKGFDGFIAKYNNGQRIN